MRISGITIPENKRLEIALTAIYGVGRSKAKEILDKIGIEYGKRVTELTEDEENKIRELVTANPIEGDLKREVASNIKRLIDIRCHRGIRHERRLPVRGQRTKTNSRTKRGKRVTMGSGKVKVTKK